MLNSLSLEPNDIAIVIYNLYKNEFKCCSAKKNIWFQFKNHRWVEIDDAIELRKRLSKEVVDEYDILDRFLGDQIAQITDEDDKDLKRKKKETVGKIIKKLKNTGFKKMVIQECNELFHDPKFEDKLDKNLNLIGFENGIYDLGELKFRDGIPEDYISFTTNINYYEHDEDDDDIIAVKEFMTQVLPKKAVREYVWTLLGSFLWGKNINEKFHIWTGCGGNGKSKLIELYEYCFGDYCCKLPVKLLTESRGRAEGANPTLVRTKGKRFACLQEPDKYEEINVGLMKELTGNDTIIARALHKDPIEFKPQFKMVLTCNDLPKVSANDRGTWRRISVVEFISNFVEDPDPSEPYEFMIDETLDEKLKIWPEAFMYLLLEYFKKYKKYGIKEPNEVKRNTEDYKVDSDMFVGFFSEKLIEVENPENGGIKLDDIYFVYQDWHKQACGQNAKCPTRKDLKDNLVKKYGKKAATSSKNVWIGLAFKENTMTEILLDEDGDEEED
jgi:P4 family phage/plasmid primase-like protien